MNTGLLALDLDGTILNAGREPVPGILRELQAWRAQGWAIAVITSRWRKAEVLGRILPDAHTRSYGAQIYVQRLELSRLWLEPHTAQQALAAVPAGANLRVMTANYCFCPAPNHPLDRRLDTLTEQHEVLKIHVQHHDAPALELMTLSWRALPNTTILRKNATTAILVAEGADKGSALSRVISAFGLTAERTLAVGNGSLDAPMLAQAGQFLRVGNEPLLQGAGHHAQGPEEVPAKLAQLRALLR